MPSSKASDRKFQRADATLQIARCLSLLPDYKGLDDDQARRFVVDEWSSQFAGYTADRVNWAVGVHIRTSPKFPTVADILEIIRKAEPQSGGLKPFRDRSPDKTPDEIARRVQHVASLKKQYPSMFTKEESSDIHWADKPMEVRPLTSEEVESLLRVTKTEAA